VTGRRDLSWLRGIAIGIACLVGCVLGGGVLGGGVLVGCVTPEPIGGDAAIDDAPPPGVIGTVELLPASTEGPGVPVDLFAVRIASIGLVGDRGPGLDPHRDGVGLTVIGTTEVDVPIGDVPPALYSAVSLDLAAEGAEIGLPVLEIRLSLAHGPTLDIATTEPISLLARCEHGAIVSTTGNVSVGMDFALGEAIGSVLLHPLPAADGDGVVHVTEATAPEAIAAFRHELAEHVHAECGPDTI
jgi:hypothetical protein